VTDVGCDGTFARDAISCYIIIELSAEQISARSTIARSMVRENQQSEYFVQPSENAIRVELNVFTEN
jgi:hypothetical protein